MAPAHLLWATIPLCMLSFTTLVVALLCHHWQYLLAFVAPSTRANTQLKHRRQEAYAPFNFLDIDCLTQAVTLSYLLSLVVRICQLPDDETYNNSPLASRAVSAYLCLVAFLQPMLTISAATTTLLNLFSLIKCKALDSSPYFWWLAAPTLIITLLITASFAAADVTQAHVLERTIVFAALLSLAVGIATVVLLYLVGLMLMSRKAIETATQLLVQFDAQAHVFLSPSKNSANLAHGRHQSLPTSVSISHSGLRERLNHNRSEGVGWPPLNETVAQCSGRAQSCIIRDVPWQETVPLPSHHRPLSPDVTVGVAVNSTRAVQLESVSKFGRPDASEAGHQLNLARASEPLTTAPTERLRSPITDASRTAVATPASQVSIDFSFLQMQSTRDSTKQPYDLLGVSKALGTNRELVNITKQIQDLRISHHQYHSALNDLCQRATAVNARSARQTTDVLIGLGMRLATLWVGLLSTLPWLLTSALAQNAEKTAFAPPFLLVLGIAINGCITAGNMLLWSCAPFQQKDCIRGIGTGSSRTTFSRRSWHAIHLATTSLPAADRFKGKLPNHSRAASEICKWKRRASLILSPKPSIDVIGFSRSRTNMTDRPAPSAESFRELGHSFDTLVDDDTDSHAVAAGTDDQDATDSPGRGRNASYEPASPPSSHLPGAWASSLARHNPYELDSLSAMLLPPITSGVKIGRDTKVFQQSAAAEPEYALEFEGYIQGVSQSETWFSFREARARALSLNASSKISSLNLPPVLRQSECMQRAGQSDSVTACQSVCASSQHRAGTSQVTLDSHFPHGSPCYLESFAGQQCSSWHPVASRGAPTEQQAFLASPTNYNLLSHFSSPTLSSPDGSHPSDTQLNFSPPQCSSPLSNAYVAPSDMKTPSLTYLKGRSTSFSLEVEDTPTASNFPARSPCSFKNSPRSLSAAITLEKSPVSSSLKMEISEKDDQILRSFTPTLPSVEKVRPGKAEPAGSMSISFESLPSPFLTAWVKNVTSAVNEFECDVPPTDTLMPDKSCAAASMVTSPQSSSGFERRKSLGSTLGLPGSAPLSAKSEKLIVTGCPSTTRNTEDQSITPSSKLAHRKSLGSDFGLRECHTSEKSLVVEVEKNTYELNKASREKHMTLHSAYSLHSDGGSSLPTSEIVVSPDDSISLSSPAQSPERTTGTMVITSSSSSSPQGHNQQVTNITVFHFNEEHSTPTLDLRRLTPLELHAYKWPYGHLSTVPEVSEEGATISSHNSHLQCDLDQWGKVVQQTLQRRHSPRSNSGAMMMSEHWPTPLPADSDRCDGWVNHVSHKRITFASAFGIVTSPSSQLSPAAFAGTPRQASGLREKFWQTSPLPLLPFGPFVSSHENENALKEFDCNDSDGDATLLGHGDEDLSSIEQLRGSSGNSVEPKSLWLSRSTNQDKARNGEKDADSCVYLSKLSAEDRMEALAIRNTPKRSTSNKIVNKLLHAQQRIPVSRVSRNRKSMSSLLGLGGKQRNQVSGRPTSKRSSFRRAVSSSDPIVLAGGIVSAPMPAEDGNPDTLSPSLNTLEASQTSRFQFCDRTLDTIDRRIESMVEERYGNCVNAASNLPVCPVMPDSEPLAITQKAVKRKPVPTVVGCASAQPEDSVKERYHEQAETLLISLNVGESHCERDQYSDSLKQGKARLHSSAAPSSVVKADGRGHNGPQWPAITPARTSQMIQFHDLEPALNHLLTAPVSSPLAVKRNNINQSAQRLAARSSRRVGDTSVLATVDENGQAIGCFRASDHDIAERQVVNAKTS